MKLTDLQLLDFGHKHQIVGIVFSNDDSVPIVAPLPGENLNGIIAPQLVMDLPDWEKVLYQSDVLDTKLVGPGQAVVRKSQRQIDQNVSWSVYDRDGYTCRYCGYKKPLTVDHVILWEAGGASVVDNLVSACKSCNRKRGNTEYAEWIASGTYAALSKGLTPKADFENKALVDKLPQLARIKVKNIRSR